PRPSVSSVKSPPIISGSAAFFAPEIGMTPLSLLPPTMRMRSMNPRFFYAQSIRPTAPLWQKARNLRLFDGVNPSPTHCTVIQGRRAARTRNLGNVDRDFRVRAKAPRNDEVRSGE